MRLSSIVLASAAASLLFFAPACKNAEKADDHTHEGEGHAHKGEGSDHAHGDKAAGPKFVAAPKDAAVSFGSLVDGAEVTSPVKVTFKIAGMTVKPAGTLDAGTGHHHLIVDGKVTPEQEVVAADATHIHFGGGQTETTVELTPGKHTLTMQFADGVHRSYGPRLSKSISVTVK